MTLEAGRGRMRENTDATDQLTAPNISARAPSRSIGVPPRSMTDDDHGDPGKADEERQGQPEGGSLRSQDDHLRQRHEHRDCGHDDRGETRRHTLFGPNTNP